MPQSAAESIMENVQQKKAKAIKKALVKSRGGSTKKKGTDQWSGLLW